MTRMILCLALTAAAIPLQSCATGSWPGAWPPTSTGCQRNNAVPFSGAGGVGFLNDLIGPHLTNLHASALCVPQPACASWQAQQHQILSGAFWSGPSSHVFTIAEQDTIVSNARNAAIAQTPAGKQFFRLTFAADIITATSASPGVVLATAYYGQCVSSVTNKKGPEDQRR